MDRTGGKAIPGTFARATLIAAVLACSATVASSATAQETAERARAALRLPPPEEIAADAPTVTEPGLLVVTLDASAPVEPLVAAAEARGYALLTRDDLAALDLVMLRFRVPAGTSGGVAIREVEAIEPLATAGVNHRFSLQSSARTTAAAPRRYADAMMGWPDAGCAPRRRLGLLDGEVNPDDPALLGLPTRRADFRDRNVDRGAAGEAGWHGGGRASRSRIGLQIAPWIG